MLLAVNTYVKDELVARSCTTVMITGLTIFGRNMA